MGVILEFRRDQHAPAALAKPREGDLGEIVIFPGVRIERRFDPSETPTQTGTPPRRRVQRSRKK